MEDFLSQAAAYLAPRGYVCKKGETREGPKFTFIHPVTKRAVLILSARGAKLVARVCAASISEYPGFVETLPTEMLAAMVKGVNCGQAEKGKSCNPWGGKGCAGGYEFIANGATHKKCRYNNFKFEVRPDTAAHILDFIRTECEHGKA